MNYLRAIKAIVEYIFRGGLDDDLRELQKD